MKETLNLLPKDLKTTEITNDTGGKSQHLFDKETIAAINAAIAINRPLLIWGETGIGKSQLAKAVAQELNQVFIPFVCDAHTESRDLLWHFDAVSRLAEAQIQGAISDDQRKAEGLNIEKFIIPQALWWGLNWESASKMEKASKPTYPETSDPKNGTVVLIDEIDKTSSDVPNGLLEALGHGAFHPQGMEVVEADKEAVPPLIIITTNGERNLPDAFIRRCLSLHLHFPANEEQQREFLVTRGKINFPDFAELMVIGRHGKQISLLDQAANCLIEDRNAAKAKHLFPLCGQAEYFDMLRGIKRLKEQGYGEPAELLTQLRPYTYQKLKG